MEFNSAFKGLTCCSICRCHPVVLGAGNKRNKLPLHNKLVCYL